MGDNETTSKSKWLSSGGKIRHVVRLQSISDPCTNTHGSLSIHRKVRKLNVSTFQS